MPRLPVEPTPYDLACAATNFYFWWQQEYPKWEARDKAIDAKLDAIMARGETRSTSPVAYAIATAVLLILSAAMFAHFPAR